MVSQCGLLLVLLGLIYLTADSDESNVATKSVNISPTGLIYIGDTLDYVEYEARATFKNMGYNLISLQPDNLYYIEHCDEFRYNSTYLLNDANCTLKRFYICERSL